VIEQLSGTVGRSDLAGHATIVKRHGRTRITGALTSDRFDIDDLSSDAGKRRGAAQRRGWGPVCCPARRSTLAMSGGPMARSTCASRICSGPAPAPSAA
jgi:hypothetical protein